MLSVATEPKIIHNGFEQKLLKCRSLQVLVFPPRLPLLLGHHSLFLTKFFFPSSNYLNWALVNSDNNQCSKSVMNWYNKMDIKKLCTILLKNKISFFPIWLLKIHSTLTLKNFNTCWYKFNLSDKDWPYYYLVLKFKPWFKKIFFNMYISW